MAHDDKYFVQAHDDSMVNLDDNLTGLGHP